MKNHGLIVLMLFVFQYKSIAQIIFNETFGNSTVRVTCPYMPSGSFTWGDPSGNIDQKSVDNNHYTVVDPTHLADNFPVPYYWWWAGPEPAGNTWGSANNPATTDHTGDANGAVLVVNAGATLHPFYQRNVQLQRGATYRLSMWFYLVNPSSEISMDIADVSNNTVLGSYDPGYLGSTGYWQQFSYEFSIGAACPSADVAILLNNKMVAFSGNDYYVDDIKLEQITPNGAPAITCPTGLLALPLKLADFSAAANGANSVVLRWTAGETSIGSSFMIERSFDGTVFTTIAATPAESNTAVVYHYSDYIPNSNPPSVYYRLKLINADKIFTFSKTVKLTLPYHPSIGVFPQPTNKGMVQVQLPTSSIYNLILLNQTGQTMHSWKNYHSPTLVINNLQKGCYFLYVQNANAPFTNPIKIIVQ